MMGVGKGKPTLVGCGNLRQGTFTAAMATMQVIHSEEQMAMIPYLHSRRKAVR